jgi:hypothetical protein
MSDPFALDQSDAARAEEPPQTLMERMAALEKKVDLLARALQHAFGERWMDELKGRNEPTG